MGMGFKISWEGGSKYHGKWEISFKILPYHRRYIHLEGIWQLGSPMFEKYQILYLTIAVTLAWREFGSSDITGLVIGILESEKKRPSLS